MVVENIGIQHENLEFGIRIKEKLLDDEKEMLRNMSEIRNRANYHTSEELKKENCLQK